MRVFGSGWFVAMLCLVGLGERVKASEPASADQLAFFERRVRPVLAEHCYDCHSKQASSIKAGLRVDSRAALLRGGSSGPAIVLGDPDASRLIQNIRGGETRMPPKKRNGLSASEIADFEQWVQWGAPWPEVAVAEQDEAYDWEAMRAHWAWQPIHPSNPPDVPSEGGWVHNPVDPFVVAGLLEKGLKPARPATPSVFVRRAFLDLIGLPPNPAERKRWVSRLEKADGSLNQQGVAELIESLLARPQYGERWGRHWLDVARYSDTGGWSQDNRNRPNAWQYRDWVVRAFNADMPFDVFVRQQIAGEQFGAEAAVGTGFFALGPSYASDGGDPESIAQAKGETLDDRVDTFARAFLGLTVACARCHDHKFDPIPTQDYYSIAGVFNNTREGETPLVPQRVVRAYNDYQDETRALERRLKELREAAKKEKRELTVEEGQRVKEWEAAIKDRKANGPAKYAFAHTLRDSGSEDMKVALRGSLLKPGPLAPRRFLRIVAGESREHFDRGSGRRQLAEAVVGPQNPLTARVFVNRVWMHHFGRALVRTPSNFGTLGETPTHPELLDWLAAAFMASGWSIKGLHRTIMTSATYQASSAFDAAGFEQDGDNRLIWRMTPRRMAVETWRDSLLSVTGELDLRPNGPAVDNIVSSRRRTLYAKVSRNDPLSSDRFLRLFDFPIPRATNAKRTANVVPQQFLFMMNSPFMVERAKALAARLTREEASEERRMDRAYDILYGRSPSEEERETALRYLSAGDDTGSSLTRWQQLCQVLLSANEFMYIR